MHEHAILSPYFCTHPRHIYNRVLQCVAVRCSAVQCVAVCCNTPPIFHPPPFPYTHHTATNLPDAELLGDAAPLVALAAALAPDKRCNNDNCGETLPRLARPLSLSPPTMGAVP